MEYTEQVVNISHVVHALADTIHVWTPVLVFILCASIIALLGYLFDSWRD